MGSVANPQKVIDDRIVGYQQAEGGDARGP
jgi:hypothetical protein